MFTQEETRTWHGLGSWICEFRAFGPTSNSTMQNVPLAGRSGMPEYFLIHLSGLFLLWPPASVSHNSAGRTHWWRVKGSALTVATHAKSAHTWCCEELRILAIWCFQPHENSWTVQKAKCQKNKVLISWVDVPAFIWREQKDREQNYSNSSRPQGMWPGSVYRQAQHVISRTRTHTRTCTHKHRHRHRQRRQRKPCYHNCTASQTDSREGNDRTQFKLIFIWTQ